MPSAAPGSHPSRLRQASLSGGDCQLLPGPTMYLWVRQASKGKDPQEVDIQERDKRQNAPPSAISDFCRILMVWNRKTRKTIT